MDVRTDLEKVTALLDELGIGYERDNRDGEIFIILKAREHEKVVGYPCFFSMYTFSENEKFIEVAIGE